MSQVYNHIRMVKTMKYALHSVSYAGAWKGQAALSLEDFICKAASLGYHGVELMAKRPHFSPLDMDDKKLAAIKSLLDSQGLECACIAGYTDFLLGVDAGMIPSVELQIANVERLSQMAQAVGCKLVRIFTGYENKNMNYQQQWDICVDAIKECAARAAKYGVTIGIQNHHDIAVGSRAVKEFITEVGEDNCLPMHDAWAPAIIGEDLEEAIMAVDKIAYTTVADYVRVPRFNYKPSLVSYSRDEDMMRAVKMGEGFIDYKKFFGALKASGYDGYVAYEMCSPIRGGGSLENLDNYASHFIEYMNKIQP